MSRVRVQIMNQFEQKSHEYKAIKRYRKLIQQDSRKLSDKRFYRPTFHMHLTNEDNIKQVHPLFQTVFKTFLKDKEKIVNALQLSYSNAKLEATNNLIKLIKRNAFGFRNFENFKKTGFYRSEYQKRKDEIYPFSSLAFLQPITVDKEPKKTGDFSPVMIQLFKIKPTHRCGLLYIHLE